VPRLTRRDLECEFYREFRAVAKAFDKAFPPKVDEYEVWVVDRRDQLKKAIKELIESGTPPKEAVEKVLGSVTEHWSRQFPNHTVHVYRTRNGKAYIAVFRSGKVLVRIE